MSEEQAGYTVRAKRMKKPQLGVPPWNGTSSILMLPTTTVTPYLSAPGSRIPLPSGPV